MVKLIERLERLEGTILPKEKRIRAVHIEFVQADNGKPSAGYARKGAWYAQFSGQRFERGEQETEAEFLDRVRASNPQSRSAIMSCSDAVWRSRNNASEVERQR